MDNTIIYQRNKLLNRLIWFGMLADLALNLVWHSDSGVFAPLIAGILVNAIFSIFIKYRKFEKFTMYGISIGLMLFMYAFILSDPYNVNLFLVFPGIALSSSYGKLPVIAATTIPTIAFMEYLVETPKYHALYFVNYDPGDQVFLHFCILLLAYVLMFLTRQNEKLRKQAEQSQQEALKANQNITKTLNEVEVTSDALNTFSQELFKNVEATNLNQNAITTSFSEIVSSINTQRNSVSEINQSMVHSNNVTSSVHESAVKLHSISQDTRMVTEKSNREVQALKDQTVTLDQVIQTSTQEMSALQEAIQKISVFLQFIMDVASQTNLLALNAAIEAARAGEHGKGFAIVAEEVRKLAESSSKATKEISQITTLIAEKSKNTADEINKISGAMHDVKQTIGTVEKTFELVLENNNTTFEQADGVQQLVAQLKDAAQRIVYEIESLSAISEQTSSNSEQIVGNLAMQEAQIQNITTSFKTLEARTNVLKDLIHQKDNQ